MRKIIISLLLLFSVQLFSQYPVQNVLVLPQGISLPLLNGYGNSAIRNDITNIGSINPASLEIFGNIAFGVSYLFESQITNSWIADIGSKRINNRVPQSIGLVIPLKNLRFAISLHQKYNRELFSEPIPITTTENPDGNGTFYKLEYQTVLYNYSITTSYSFQNISKNSDFSLGLRIGINQLSQYNNLLWSKIDASIYAINFSIGSTYTLDIRGYNFLRLGIFFESPLEFNETVPTLYNPTPILPTQDSTRVISGLATNRTSLTGSFPSTLRFDFEINTTKDTKILGDISNIFWNKIDRNYKNQIEISCSALYKFNKLFTSSLGFIITSRKYKNDFFNMTKNLKGFFLTVGITTKLSNLEIYFSLADSHLFSGDWRKQTIVKLGVGYALK